MGGKSRKTSQVSKRLIDKLKGKPKEIAEKKCKKDGGLDFSDEKE